MAAQVTKLRSLQYGGLVDPTSMSQYGQSVARDSAVQPTRMVNVMGQEEPFDVTQGRLEGAVRLTPTVISGGIVPVLNPGYQMARDSGYLANYVNMGVNGPINGMEYQDALTLAGTKFSNTTRDSQFTVEPENATGYMDQIDPITKCAPGEQIMLLRGGQPVNQRQIREVYQPYNVLSAQAQLVGVSAGSAADQQTFAQAYSTPQTRMMTQSVPLNQPPTNYPSALSGASFAKTQSFIP